MVTISKQKKDDLSRTMRVHKDFHKVVFDFIEQYYEKNSIKISTVEATNIIYDKIMNMGGLVAE